MKKFIAIAILCYFNSFAQIIIEKPDGSKINASEASFNTENEKLVYKADGKKERLKYKELKSVTSDDFVFRYFPEGRKFKGYFVKAETASKTLAFVHYTLSAGSTTGFQSTFEHVDLAVFDNKGKLLEEIDLRPGTSGKNIEKRTQALEIIKKHFSDCPNLINDITSFINAQEDSKKMRITYYFQQRENKFIGCE